MLKLIIGIVSKGEKKKLVQDVVSVQKKYAMENREIGMWI